MTMTSGFNPITGLAMPTLYTAGFLIIFMTLGWLTRKVIEKVRAHQQKKQKGVVREK